MNNGHIWNESLGPGNRRRIAKLVCNLFQFCGIDRVLQVTWKKFGVAAMNLFIPERPKPKTVTFDMPAIFSEVILEPQ